MSSGIWKIDGDFCRCCHSKGVFTSLGDTCNHIIPNQKYVDMLRDSLDVCLSVIPGELRTITYKICDECVSQLHAIAKFKKQVKICEDRFMDMYSRNLIKLADTIEQPIIKVELDDSEDDYKEDFTEMDFDDDDDDDPIIDIRKQNTKKDNVKNSKPKSKTKKTAKKTAKPKKTSKIEIEIDTKNGADAEADADAEPDADPGAEADAVGDVKTEGAEKKGHKRRAKYYTVTQGTYTCDMCNRTYASQPLVSQHYRYVHLKRHRARERKCPHCDTKVPGYLRAYHLEEVHGIPAPKCGICDKKFRFPCHVLQHQKKVHMGEKTAQCEICSKSFFNNISLRLHMSTHSEEKRFKCDVCERVFRWENNLKDHLKVHLGDKRYGCVVCGKAFVQKSTLKQHAARNHPGIEAYTK